MVEVLHLAAVLPATVGLCCAVGDRRGRARSVVPAAAMLLAMLAMASGWPVVPPLAWTALLLALGVGSAARLRTRAADHADQHARHMQLHRALGLVLGAGLLVVVGMGGDHGESIAMGHAGHSGGSLPIAMLAGAAGHLAFTAWLVARSLRHRSPVVGAVEASAMGLMTMMMAIMPLVG